MVLVGRAGGSAGVGNVGVGVVFVVVVDIFVGVGVVAVGVGVFRRSGCSKYDADLVSVCGVDV